MHISDIYVYAASALDPTALHALTIGLHVYVCVRVCMCVCTCIFFTAFQKKLNCLFIWDFTDLWVFRSEPK